jgi:hypothetical protein
MQLNVPPDLETLINKRLSGGGYTSIEKTYSAAPLKRRTPRKAGPTRNAGRCPLISRKAIYRPSAASLSTALTPAMKFRR